MRRTARARGDVSIVSSRLGPEINQGTICIRLHRHDIGHGVQSNALYLSLRLHREFSYRQYYLIETTVLLSNTVPTAARLFGPKEAKPDMEHYNQNDHPSSLVRILNLDSRTPASVRCITSSGIGSRMNHIIISRQKGGENLFHSKKCQKKKMFKLLQLKGGGRWGGNVACRFMLFRRPLLSMYHKPYQVSRYLSRSEPGFGWLHESKGIRY
ncbi:hypothetical protein BGX38DRAFT_1196380 [Terfezia claveryi]|nr:hypothetical protein BGX38DRAFT_1196380 [Terfezia claveryi]